MNIVFSGSKFTQTPVLDASTGKPAEGVVIRLQQLERGKDADSPDIFHPLAKG